MHLSTPYKKNIKMNSEVFLRGENRNVIKFLWNIDHFSQEKTLGTLEVKFIHLNLVLK